MTDLEMYNLQDNLKLSTLHFKDEDEWLELRRQGIGGSDIGAILELNKFNTPLQIYKQKVEGWNNKASSNVNVKKGKELEDVILHNRVIPLLSEKGYVVSKPDFMIINEDMPYLRANVDGIAYKPGTSYENNLIIEIKYVSEFAEAYWNTSEYGGIPASYYAQVQLYMAVTGCKNALVCALFDSDWDLHTFLIPRDEDFINQILIKAKHFYDYNMLCRIPPMLDTELDRDFMVEAVKNSPDGTELSSEMTILVDKYRQVNEEIKKLDSKKTKIADAIFDLHRKGFIPDEPDRIVKCSVITSHRFNSKKFKDTDPDLYEQYCEDSESSRFIIK